MAVSSYPPDADGERKQITVLFCDVVGYTARSAALDAEELLGEMRGFYRICARIAAAHHGRVAQFLGDGVLILFGHPRASECDPHRAVSAGLAIVDKIRRVKIRRGCAPLAVRIGIATGEVVLAGARDGRYGEMIFGRAPNLASRLQQLARPNTVVVSRRTRRLVGGVFALCGLGARRARGFAHSVRAWRVMHEHAVALRPAKCATRFVGRERELRRLREQHRETLRGRARIVHVRGAAGIGKSRLALAFESTVRTPCVRLRILCASEFRARAFKPILYDAPPGRARAAIRRGLHKFAPGGMRERALLGELLGAPPRRRAWRPLDALANLVIKLSRRRPVLLLVEDLHRADAATLRALGALVARARGGRLFAVFTSREDFTAPWPRAATRELRLGRLNAGESAQLVSAVFGAHAPRPPTRDALLRAGGGVPLLLEEMSRQELREMRRPQSRDSPQLVREPSPEYERAASPLVIPDTLRNFLNARLDQLGEWKPFAQLAAALEENFRYSLLRRIAARNGMDAAAGLAALAAAGLLMQLPENCGDLYAFCPAVFRDAACAALLEKTRRKYRQQISELTRTNGARR
ncbi:MAG: AAA family ATPase [Gammaproteobacteria bacterium]|nr:AAA family ATPase [Gammaproteobacteria bacterium]